MRTMYPFAKIMALFWTLAEGIIFLYLRWGYLKLKGRDADQRRWVIFCSAIFCVLTLWLLCGEALVHPMLTDIYHTKVYRWGTWNFFCTLWVGLEGIIMIYVVRIRSLLLSGGRDKAGKAAATILWPLFALFALYHFPFFAAVLNQGMKVVEINNVALFYIRICGLLWIVFEWFVAVYGLKTYGLLREGAKIRGTH